MTSSALCICCDSTGREHNAKILDLCVILHWGQMSSLVLYTVNAVLVPNPNDSPIQHCPPFHQLQMTQMAGKKRIVI